MTTLFHKGVPCTPPIVNGVPFKDRGDGVFLGDVPDGREDEFLRIPAYSIEDPAPPKLSKKAQAAADAAAAALAADAAAQAALDAKKAQDNQAAADAAKQ